MTMFRNWKKDLLVLVVAAASAVQAVRCGAGNTGACTDSHGDTIVGCSP